MVCTRGLFPNTTVLDSGRSFFGQRLAEWDGHLNKKAENLNGRKKRCQLF